MKLINQPVKRRWVGFPGHDILFFSGKTLGPQEPHGKMKGFTPRNMRCNPYKMREFRGFPWYLYLYIEYLVARSHLPLQFYCSPISPWLPLPGRIVCVPRSKPNGLRRKWRKITSSSSLGACCSCESIII